MDNIIAYVFVYPADISFYAIMLSGMLACFPSPLLFFFLFFSLAMAFLGLQANFCLLAQHNPVMVVEMLRNQVVLLLISIPIAFCASIYLWYSMIKDEEKKW
jgi:hypothetical protein